MAQYKHPIFQADLRDVICYAHCYRKEGLIAITVEKGDGHDLWILNYTERCNQIAPEAWPTHLSLMRGLVLRVSGYVRCADDDFDVTDVVVVLAPMPKFHSAHRFIKPFLDGTRVYVMEKHDGSCVTVGLHKGKLVYATRGSVRGMQCTLAAQLVRASGGEEKLIALLQNGVLSLTFELIHEDDGKVVLSRGPNRLILLYAVQSDGFVVPLERIQSVAETLSNVSIVPITYVEMTLGEAKAQLEESSRQVATYDALHEGKVVKFVEPYVLSPEVSVDLLKLKASVYLEVDDAFGKGLTTALF